MKEKPAHITVDCSRWQGDLDHIWTGIMYDEINYTCLPRGRALLREIRNFMEKPYYVRMHNSLTSGSGYPLPRQGSTNVYLEKKRNPVYDFTLFDQIFDVLVSYGFFPIVELGFMPEPLAREGHMADPPKDFARWEELISKVVEHCVHRYGKEVCSRWYWELWNEPDLDFYWRGTAEEYFALYDHTVHAATQAFPDIKIGGPAAATFREKGNLFQRFLEHCIRGENAATGDRGARLDFISFHAKGGKAERLGYFTSPYLSKQASYWHPKLSNVIEQVKQGLAIISKFPELEGIPVQVNECDIDVGVETGMYENPNLVYRNTEYYASFLTSMCKRILDVNQDPRFTNRVNLICTAAFYYEGSRIFEGQRTLVTSFNIGKPVLNALRALSRMGRKRLSLFCDEKENAVEGLVSLKGQESLQILLWYRDDDWSKSGNQKVEVKIKNPPFAEEILHHYRIDSKHSNSFAEWIRQGKPYDPSPSQLASLKSQGKLEEISPPTIKNAKEGGLLLQINLPLHGVSFLEWNKI